MWQEQNEPLNGIYDWAEFTLSNGQTNYDVKSNVAALFSNIPRARSAIIVTNKNITCRFNNSSYPAIKINAVNSPAEFMRRLDITNIYLTNSSGADATIDILLLI